MQYDDKDYDVWLLGFTWNDTSTCGIVDREDESIDQPNVDKVVFLNSPVDNTDATPIAHAKEG